MDCLRMEMVSVGCSRHDCDLAMLTIYCQCVGYNVVAMSFISFFNGIYGICTRPCVFSLD
jgi:hypothetical protein